MCENIEILDVSAEEYQQAYVDVVGHNDDTVVQKLEDGYIDFVSADGRSVSDLDAPEYIREQSWSYLSEEGSAERYARIDGDDTRLYELQR